MTQMNLFGTETDSQKQRTYGCQGGWCTGERWIGIWGLADANYYI